MPDTWKGSIIEGDKFLYGRLYRESISKVYGGAYGVIQDTGRAHGTSRPWNFTSSTWGSQVLFTAGSLWEIIEFLNTDFHNRYNRQNNTPIKRSRLFWKMTLLVKRTCDIQFSKRWRSKIILFANSYKAE